MSGHRSNEFVICPYCNHKHEHSYELFSGFEDSVDVVCEACGDLFHAVSTVMVTYTTSEIES